MKDLVLTGPDGTETTVSQLSDKHLSLCVERMREGRFINESDRPNSDVWDRLQIELVIRQIDAQGGL